MNKIILLIIPLLLIAGCTSNNTTGNVVNTINVDHLEVIHFHATNQCWSCITVGAYAEQTINNYFSNEIASGLITFKHVNGELSENSELVKKYGVTGSSLFIGVYGKDGSFKAIQDTKVWYKVNNQTDYTNYFKDLINKRLTGDLS